MGLFGDSAVAAGVGREGGADVSLVMVDITFRHVFMLKFNSLDTNPSPFLSLLLLLFFLLSRLLFRLPNNCILLVMDLNPGTMRPSEALCNAFLSLSEAPTTSLDPAES